jgi:ribosome modulation factor
VLEGFNPPLPTCDFCSTEHVDLVMTISSEHTIYPDGTPNPYWLACTDCAALFRAGKFHELLDRAVAGSMTKNNFPAWVRPQVRAEILHGWRIAFADKMAGL